MSTSLQELAAIKVTGRCDGGCGKPVKVWFGQTSAAHCGDARCYATVNESYKETCRIVDEEFNERHGFPKGHRWRPHIYGDE